MAAAVNRGLAPGAQYVSRVVYSVRRKAGLPCPPMGLKDAGQLPRATAVGGHLPKGVQAAALSSPKSLPMLNSGTPPMGLLSPERAPERNIGGLRGVKRPLPGNKVKKRIEKQTTCRLARMCWQHNGVLRYLYSKWDF